MQGKRAPSSCQTAERARKPPLLNVCTKNPLRSPLLSSRDADDEGSTCAAMEASVASGPRSVLRSDAAKLSARGGIMVWGTEGRMMMHSRPLCPHIAQYLRMVAPR